MKDGLFTQSVCEKFTVITKNALNQFINDKITDRLKFAMSDDTTTSTSTIKEGSGNQSNDAGNNILDEIITTEEEKEGYLIIKSILRENFDLKRIFMRYKKSYCGILLDDNNRKPICRMYFNTKQKYLGLYDKGKNEEKIPIEDLNGIYGYADKLKSIVSNYDNGTQKTEGIGFNES